MKRIFITCIFILFIVNMFANELIHSYFGNYRDIIRMVFVFRSEVFYSSFMDTDNRVLNITAHDTKLAEILPLSFTDIPLIERVEYRQEGADTNISIFTSVVYHAEIFDLRGENFKVVVDIYRQRTPHNIELASSYLAFFRAVGFRDRADELQARIDRNEFLVPVTFSNENEQINVENITNVTINELILLEDFITESLKEDTIELTEQKFLIIDPLLYEKPDISNLDNTLREWITEAFRVYGLFMEFHNKIERIEHTLRLYDSQTTISISFIAVMSENFNFLSVAGIRLNELRLKFRSVNNRRVLSREPAIIYTNEMINHITHILDSYEVRISFLQRQYNIRLNN